MQPLGVHKDNEIRACLFGGMSMVETARRCNVSLGSVLRRKRLISKPRRPAWQPQRLNEIFDPNYVGKMLLDSPKTCPNCNTVALLSEWWEKENVCPFCQQ